MKKMTLLIAGLSLMGLAACGSSPEEDCARSAAAECERMYTCDSSVKVGDDQADCVNDIEALCRAVIETRDGKPCEGEQEYDSAAANRCVDETKALSCDDYNAGNGAPSCEQVCK